MGKPHGKASTGHREPGVPALAWALCWELVGRYPASMLIRSLPLVALALLAAWPTVTAEAASLLETGPPQNKSPDKDSAKSCGACHTAIFKEWDGRAHSNAWTDEIYQASIKKKKRPKACHSCHIPERVLARPTRKPKTRKKLLHEGVTCVSCHEKDGEIHGPFGAKTDAHKSVKDALFTDASKLCMSCHSTKIDIVLPVGRQFRNAELEKKGKSCAGCHMPEITRHLAIDPDTGKPVGDKRKGRSHALLGPRDPEFCATAFKLSTKKNGDELVLTIENGAGHDVPGLRTRAFHFLVSQKDKGGKTLSDKTVVIDAENPLEVLKQLEFKFEFAAGLSRISGNWLQSYCRRLK